MALPRGVEARFVGAASPTAPRAGAGGHPCQGLYWRPSGKSPRTAIIAAHYNVDFSEHYAAPLFAAAGYGFLGWNTRYRGAEDQFLLEQALIDIAVGVHWLKETAGVERVVILGNSGGGSMMAAYQAEACEPTLAAQARGVASQALASLPAADLYISLNAHKGRPEVLTAWMDPSVIDERDPRQTDPELDAFLRRPPFEDAFILRYREAQRARNQRITDWVRGQLASENAAEATGILFPLYRTWADLRFLDGTIDPSKRATPSCYAGDPQKANRRPGIGRVNSLKTWLSMWSLETSPCRGETHLARLRLPALVVQSMSDVGVFPSDARAIHAALGSADKRLEFVPGAHYFEDAPDHRRDMVDLVASWIAKRS